MVVKMLKYLSWVPTLLLISCTSSSNIPLLGRSLVEVPTAVAGVLETDGYCYRLNMTGGTRTIVWVEGTRFGQDANGYYVTDIDGIRRYSGQRVGLSGGPLSAQHLSQNPRFSQYVRDCGQDLITGLRFTGV